MMLAKILNSCLVLRGDHPTLGEWHVEIAPDGHCSFSLWTRPKPGEERRPSDCAGCRQRTIDKAAKLAEALVEDRPLDGVLET